MKHVREQVRRAPLQHVVKSQIGASDYGYGLGSPARCGLLAIWDRPATTGCLLFGFGVVWDLGGRAR